MAYEFVKTLRDCGYTWVLVQEHSVEPPENGHGIGKAPAAPSGLHQFHGRDRQHHRHHQDSRAATPSWWRRCSPTTKPRACRAGNWPARSVPPLVTQIADGENGGVMMNEFPGKFMEAVREASGSDVPFMNATEYLEYLFATGIKEIGSAGHPADLAEADLGQVKPGRRLGEAGARPSRSCKKEDHRFHMDGGSWTNNISWVRGYDSLLGPMEQMSAHFYEKVLKNRSWRPTTGAFATPCST